MATYVAFLRAINLGARRKFPAADLAAAVEAAGGTGVATYLNTGNVRLESRQRSVGRVARTLEQAFAADRRFEVPTVVFTLRELRELVDQADEVARAAGGSAPAGEHYVSLLPAVPDPGAADALEAASREGEQVRVRGRGVHLLLPPDQGYQRTRLGNDFVERHAGTATSRNVRVLRSLRDRWC